ncbi:Carbohydrate-binding CenC domain protein [Hymenobacter roseosalivarius DSM 11622]|uniref:Carbohydrate-binding CenC domain protein n=1 Tax=Hymenobacter roseosalivarius DSM 11622 TaxID=645990 RepID=A0A1W1VJL9_9BACT|nr:carbohydrate binding domain-containing protein [Hymenobacter roseosalivarius]SMB93516.1 Carbohydrate-binding CenC domain protein [Hymenobacter roseosalivarius DSM 11622]
MRHLAIGLALVLLTTACSQNAGEKNSAAGTGRVLVDTSFEDLEGWIPENPSLTQEKAHTGRYSIKIDPGTEFSLTYINQLYRLSPKRFNTVRLTAWGQLTAPGAAAVVFQITRADQTTAFYEKIDIKEVNEWGQINKVLTMPAVLNPADQVKIYLWRATATAPAYLDDLTLSVEP